MAQCEPNIPCDVDDCFYCPNEPVRTIGVIMPNIDNMTIAGSETMQNTTSARFKVSSVAAKLVYRYENERLNASWEEQ